MPFQHNVTFRTLQNRRPTDYDSMDIANRLLMPIQSFLKQQMTTQQQFAFNVPVPPGHRSLYAKFNRVGHTTAYFAVGEIADDKVENDTLVFLLPRLDREEEKKLLEGMKKNASTPPISEEDWNKMLTGKEPVTQGFITSEKGMNDPLISPLVGLVSVTFFAVLGMVEES